MQHGILPDSGEWEGAVYRCRRPFVLVVVAPPSGVQQYSRAPTVAELQVLWLAVDASLFLPTECTARNVCCVCTRTAGSNWPRRTPIYASSSRGVLVSLPR